MVIGACATQHRMRMLVGNMRLLKVDNDLALLQVAEDLRPRAEDAQQELSNLLSTAWGQQVRVEIEGMPAAPPATSAAGAGKPPSPPAVFTASSEPPEPPRIPIAEHPLVKQAIELFGAKVTGVQPRRKASE